jgi:peroxiredoxin
VLSEGEPAPRFELPALVDGERRRVSLEEYLYEDVVILAFYPADFNPACDEESCDLDELDLFTMQKDVTILGISPDSVYSHRAFAERYDLKVPLLSDTDGSVAEQYDISLADDIGQHLLERAVAVVNHDGEIQYAWSTEEMTKLPRVEEIKDAIAETGGDDTAFARYRVGHAHYTEGRRAFTSAMSGFQDSEWMMAQKDFQQAREEFEEAADQFDTAVRFVDEEAVEPVYEDSKTKATALWQAADWLTQSAKAYSSGSGAEGQELREDAERPLETARGYAEPPDPDEEWPPEVENLEKDEDEEYSILPTEDEPADTALDVDIDAEMGADEEIPVGNGTEHEDDAAVDVSEEAAESPAVAGESAGSDIEGDNDSDGEGQEDIDDEELAEIQAELEANSPDEEPSVDEITEESTAIVDAPPMAPDEAGEAGDAESGVGDESTADDKAVVEGGGESDESDGAVAGPTEAADRDEESDGDAAGSPEPVADGPEETEPTAAESEPDESSTGEPAVDGPEETEPAADEPADTDDGDAADEDVKERAKEELAELRAQLDADIPDDDE